MTMTTQAVILVGGKGTRLGALTARTPKPLMPIDGDRVFLDDVLVEVARHGFDDILLLAGHLHEQFEARYADRRLQDARIRVTVEPEPAGTAGALHHARDLLAEQFLFLNGDTLFDINLRGLDPLLKADPALEAAMALRRVPDRNRYGSVEIAGDRVIAFAEKQPGAGPAEGLINGGIGLFRRRILDRIGSLPASLESDVYPALAREGRLGCRAFDGYFIDIGLPDTLQQARDELPARRRRPALFLDRDGVINHDAGYTHRVEDLAWIEGAREVIRQANQLGALVIVVTNQAGIGRGKFTEADMHAFHRAIRRDLAEVGAHLDAVYWCPYHADAVIERYRHPDHPDRKPNPGMLTRALADWAIDADASVMIGDTDADMAAAAAAGIAGLRFPGGDLAAFAAPALERLAALRRQPCE